MPVSFSHFQGGMNPRMFPFEWTPFPLIHCIFAALSGIFFFSSPFIIHYSDGIRVRHGHFVSVISIGKILKTWKMIIENTRYSQGIQPDSLALPEGHTDRLNLEKACWPFNFLFEMQSFTDSYPQVSFSWAGIIAYSFPTSMEAAYLKSHEVTCRLLLPWWGIEPLCPSQRKCRVLTTGPSENYLTSLWMHEINDFASTENGCVSIFGEVNEVATASDCHGGWVRIWYMF